MPALVTILNIQQLSNMLMQAICGKRMNAGDLVVIKNAHQNTLHRLGFITNIQDRHNDGTLWVFVRFPKDGRGWWYHPDKVETISKMNNIKNEVNK